MSLELFPHKVFEPIDPEELKKEFEANKNLRSKPSSQLDAGEIKIERPLSAEPKNKNMEKSADKIIGGLSAVMDSVERFISSYRAKEDTNQEMQTKKLSPKEEIDDSKRFFIKSAATGLGIIAGGMVVEKFGKAKKSLEAINNAVEDFSAREEEYSPSAEEKAAEEMEERLVVPEKPKSKIEIKNIADHYLKPHDELRAKTDFFPTSIFSDNFLIAQEIQESGGDIEAESSKGAFGLMQTMEISIKDVSLFLERLHANGVINYDGPIYVGDFTTKIEALKKERNNLVAEDLKNSRTKKTKGDKRTNSLKIISLNKEINEWRGELERKKKKYGDRVLSDSDLVAMKIWITDDPKYSRALGELYLMRLYHNKYGNGAGYKQLNVDHDIQAAQTEILGAYNAGYSEVKEKPIEKWLGEPRTYVKRIFNLMDRASNVRNELEKAGLDRKDNEIVRRIVLELGKVTTVGDKRNEVLEKSLNYLIEQIKIAKEEKGAELDKQDIDKIFERLSKIKEISVTRFYS